MSNLVPKYCFIDAQNFDSFFFKKGEKTGENRYVDYRSLSLFLKKRIKVTPDKIFIFFKNTLSHKKIYLIKQFGYQVVLCKAKTENKNGSDSHNIDTDLIITSLTEYFEEEDHDLVLLTGDGDFIPLLDFYEERGASVELICPSRSKKLDGRSPTSSKLLTKDIKTGEQRAVLFLDEIEGWNFFRN